MNLDEERKEIVKQIQSLPKGAITVLKFFENVSLS
jgi:hypothetical protein